MSAVSLTVKSLKGQVLHDLEMNSMNTVRELKYVISSRMSGQRVDSMRLIYRAKPMSEEGQSLASYGIRPGHTPVSIHLVARFNGGGISATQEIAAQLKAVLRARLFGVELIEPEDDWSWNIMLRGPKKSPFSKGLFSLTFDFPEDYPYSPPTIKFNTPIFHPNVYSCGKLCWDENDSSGSRYSADVLIGAVNCLLEEPNTESPANREAANLLHSDRDEYDRQAREHTRLHAGFQ